MPIGTVKYENGAFQVALDWQSGVTRAIVYARAADQGMAEPEMLLYAEKNRRLRAEYSGNSYMLGAPMMSYAPDSALAFKWVDLYCLDLGRDDRVISHTCHGRVFNGRCLIEAYIQRVSIASGWDAVRIHLRNRSGFDLAARGVGYRVEGRHYLIPATIPARGVTRLPQFECPQNAVLQLERVEGGYPAEIRMVNSLKELGGE